MLYLLLGTSLFRMHTQITILIAAVLILHVIQNTIGDVTNAMATVP